MSCLLCNPTNTMHGNNKCCNSWHRMALTLLGGYGDSRSGPCRPTFRQPCSQVGLSAATGRAAACTQTRTVRRDQAVAGSPASPAASTGSPAGCAGLQLPQLENMTLSFQLLHTTRVDLSWLGGIQALVRAPDRTRQHAHGRRPGPAVGVLTAQACLLLLPDGAPLPGLAQAAVPVWRAPPSMLQQPASWPVSEFGPHHTTHTTAGAAERCAQGYQSLGTRPGRQVSTSCCMQGSVAGRPAGGAAQL